jgi:Protein of unknown function (DUF3052)
VAGYSGTPLAKKLGIKPGHVVALLNAPEGFAANLEGLPEGVDLRDTATRGEASDVIVFFTVKSRDLANRFAALKDRLDVAGGLWVAWPKRASGVTTDLTETVVREVGLAGGLVDNKVCAIDDTWSGLRFVRRLTDRGR